MEGESSSSNSSRVVRNEGIGLRIENPFALKVGQVFTGFGVGCGVGIGVGRPLNLGAIPMLNQVMSATRGATDAFSGVSRHVNSSLRKLGAKNIEVGIGCGVGFGHGFGVGLAVKPVVLHQIHSCFVAAMTKVMMRFGIAPNLLFGHGTSPTSLQSGVRRVNTPPNPISIGSMMHVGSTSENIALNSNVADSNFGSRTEKVLGNFLENPLLKGEENGLDQSDGRLRSENNILRMVLKHQQIIDELMEENEKLRQILVEDLKIPSSKLQASSSSGNKLPCTYCFECRRKQKKR